MKRNLLLAAGSALLGVALMSLALLGRGADEGLPPGSNASLEPSGSLSGPAPAVSQSYDLSAHQTLSRVIILLKENYVEPERVRPYEMFLAALDYIQKTVPEVIVDDSEAPKRIKVSAAKNEHSFDLDKLGGLDQLWEVTLALRDIFRFLQTHIADPEQRRDIEYAAINGMLSTLDPHSVLLKPESFNEVKLSTKGEFGGLGIVISIRDGALTVISPIADTPAARSGIKAQDQIVKIGEESTINMGLEEAVERLRGKPGSKINIWIKRKKWTEAKKFTLTRDIIKIQSVASRLLERGVGYLKVKNFQANTFDDMHAALETMRRKNKGELKGLVLDLRNNPGGLLDQAILISDRFIEKGPLVITVGEGSRKRDVKSAHAAGTEANYPIAVLTNGGSASASEIVAGALKNHNRAIVIGQQTFGKGSVQVLYDFKDRSALKLTIAQYLTPGDVSIQSVGITPDVEIMPATIEDKDVHMFVNDDSPREQDLDRHLDTPEVVRESESLIDVSESTAPSGEPGVMEKPSVRIVHLIETKDPAKPEADSEAEEAQPESTEEFEYDFETRLAHDVLASAQSFERPRLLAESRQLFTSHASMQEQAIVKKLEQVGVNWATGAKEAGGGAATLEFQVAGAQKGPVLAGDTVTLTATVKNTGATTLWRVYGLTRSENPLFKNLEFVFGKVAPGDTRSWSVEVKLPKDLSARADDVVLTVGDLHERLKGTKSTNVVSIEEREHPRFAYSTWIDDRTGGNGDGVLQAGEKVAFMVSVRNVGTVVSEEALVTLKNMASEAVFLDRGREKVTGLKPGKDKTVELRFQLRPNDVPSLVDMRVAVWDSVFGEPVSQTIKLPVLPARKAKSENKVVRVEGAAEAPLFAGADAGAAILGYAKPGAMLRSDASFDGWYRVDLSPGAPAFVRDVDVKLAPGRKASPQGVRALMSSSVPAIDLQLASLVTAEPAFRLVGNINDEQPLKDVFIFVNEKKVFYDSYGQLQPDKGTYRAPLDLTVPLKPGSNTIAVVARESADLVTRRVFGVYRSEPVVAEGSTDRGATPKQAAQ